ncbi:family 1 glycosylhydrolase [Leifsonia sp. ZF2019]|uniref:family 1 glycosylhydrolase n=1 Tax=Leifsonia sp. ZF2019 TaxID=2781978 RepID=UPI001CBF2A58|nr:family 1 glycosylhydrolase [Leifsonia sp. ZF2019]UAJ79327.1 family 1 glycosylhydrolase [Leifsonia sp. ZF2019]
MTDLTPHTFPAGFAWGVSLGAHQTEGGNVASDAWFRENQPDSSLERCGDAVDGYHRWPEDLALAVDAGFTDYRFGIEWSRIEPADGFISRAAVDHYRRIVEAAVARGLQPTVTLYHFTLPLWFTASGGWGRPDAIDRFLRYIDALAPVLEAGAARVMTINEPNIVAVTPLLRNGAADLQDGIPAPDPGLSAFLVDLHHAAASRLRAHHPHLAVGWGVSVQDYRAIPGAEDDLERYAEPRDQVFLRASAGDDYVGVQTYTGTRVGPGAVAVPDRTAPRTLTGWEYLPDALGGAVARAARVVPSTPIIVTENGIATADDAQRIEYTTGALLSLRAAMVDGADVRGYFHWSLLDNWEWGHWAPTFGLVAVDRETFARTPRPSLAWLGALAPRPAA